MKHVALLRAVNVGGTGKLPMADLRALCVASGFRDVRTWIASGNVVFESDATATDAKAVLEAALAHHLGKRVGVVMRDAAQLHAVLDANPFRDVAPNRVVVVFLDIPPPGDALATVRHHAAERLALGAREIYVDYGERMAESKLVIPAAREGTGRNLNTVARLAEMASE